MASIAQVRSGLALLLTLAARAALDSASPAARRVVAVGIDLGTTNSAVCVFDVARREPVAVRNSRGETLTPSVVSFLPGGEVLVGRDAIDAAPLNPLSTFRSVKRLLGRDLGTDAERALANRLLPTKDSLLRGAAGVRLSCPALGRELRLEEVSAAVLRALVADVLAYLAAGGGGDSDGVGGEAGEAVGVDELRCVITVPAQFDDRQREATEVAARLAGLRHVRLMREPVAAALAFGVMGSAQSPADGGGPRGAAAAGGGAGGAAGGEQTVLVIDVGAGTTDVSVLEVRGGLVQVLANSADGRLGGDDIDDALEGWLLGALEAGGHGGAAAALRAQPALRFGARRALEAAKVSLSVRREAEVALPCAASGQPPGDGCPPLTLALSRAQLDAAAEPVLARLKRPVYEAALNAKLTLQGERSGGAGGAGSGGAEGGGEGAQGGKARRKGAGGRTGGGQKQGGGRPSQPSAGDMAVASDGSLERSRALPAGRALDALVMVGGMSHMLGVRKLAANLAGVDVRRTVDPMEAVARGAALQAAVSEGLAVGMAVEDAWQAQLRAAYEQLQAELAARAERDRAWREGQAAGGGGAGGGSEGASGAAEGDAAALDWSGFDELGGDGFGEDGDEDGSGFGALGVEAGDEVVWMDEDGNELEAPLPV